MGRPFVGKAGLTLDTVFPLSGLMREECNIANVVRTRPPDNNFRLHGFEAVSEGLQDLRALIKQLQPSLIVALGNEAAWDTIQDWPDHDTNWINGASGINDRRGFFFPYKYDNNLWVMPTLHPANVSYKSMPSSLLLELDFRRIHDWLVGDLPREEFPEVEIVDSYLQMKRLMSSEVLASDIETRWDSTELLCSGFCGDDLKPLCVPHTRTPMVVETYEEHGNLCFHHGQYDVYMLQEIEKLRVKGFNHDTMFQHWALFPELASKEDTGGEYSELHKAQKMTRKGLAFLASMRMNVKYWKLYPPEDDPNHLALMMELCGRDCYVTRRLHNMQMPEIIEADVLWQYEQRMRLIPVAIKMQARGLTVNEELRKERMAALKERGGAAKEAITIVGLDYIWEHELEAFRVVRKCFCCNGGKVVARNCWRCGSLSEKPGCKADYRPLVHSDEGVHILTDVPMSEVETDEQRFKRMKVAELRALLPECKQCAGTGRIHFYTFNPFSGPQMIELLMQIGVPKSLWGTKKKQADELTLGKILHWARGGGKKKI